MKRALIAACCAASVVLAGCGEDSESSTAMSVEDYRAELDAACATLFGELDQLASEANDETLEPAEVETRADTITSEFNATVEELTPPDELADAHSRMVELGDEAPDSTEDLQAFLDYERENLAVFEELGAEDCIAGEQEAIEQLEAAG